MAHALFRCPWLPRGRGILANVAVHRQAHACSSTSVMHNPYCSMPVGMFVSPHITSCSLLRARPYMREGDSECIGPCCKRNASHLKADNRRFSSSAGTWKGLLQRATGKGCRCCNSAHIKSQKEGHRDHPDERFSMISIPCMFKLFKHISGISRAYGWTREVILASGRSCKSSREHLGAIFHTTREKFTTCWPRGTSLKYLPNT